MAVVNTCGWEWAYSSGTSYGTGNYECGRAATATENFGKGAGEMYKLSYLTPAWWWWTQPRTGRFCQGFYPNYYKGGSLAGYDVEWPLHELDATGFVNQAKLTYQTGYLTWWIKLTAAPVSGARRICRVKACGTGNAGAQVLMNTDRTLQLQYNLAGAWTNIGSASAAVSYDVWHKIGFKALSTNTAGSTGFELQLDGSTVATGSNLTPGTPAAIYWFAIGTTYVVDDPFCFFADDAMWKSDGYGDDGGLYFLEPMANGSAMGNWRSYQDYYSLTAEGGKLRGGPGILGDTVNQPLLLDMASCAEMGISGTITTAKLMINQTGNLAPTLTSMIGRLKSGATTVDTTTAVQPTGYVGATKFKMFDTDPNTSAAWTIAGLDAVECGGMATVYGAGEDYIWIRTVCLMVWCATLTDKSDRYVAFFDGLENGFMDSIGTNAQIDTSHTRTGYYCGRITLNSGDGYGGGWGIGQIDSWSDDLYWTFWIRMEAYPSAEHDFVASQNEGNNAPNMPLYMTIDASGYVRTYGKVGTNNFTLLGTSTDPVPLGEYVRYDVTFLNMYKLGQSGAQTIEVKIAGTVISTGEYTTFEKPYGGCLLTPYFGWTTYGNKKGDDTSCLFYVDDVIVRTDHLETTDGGVLAIKVTAAGADTEWTGTYAAVDEIPPGPYDSSTYLASSGSSYTEGYGSMAPGAYGDYYVAGSISAVKVAYLETGASASYAHLSPSARVSGVRVRYPWSYLPGPPYLWYTSTRLGSWMIWGVNPTTHSAWALSDLADVQPGATWHHGYTGGNVRHVTDLWVEVWCSTPGTVPPLPDPFPTISTISPNHALVGATGAVVTITGTNLSGSTAIYIGGVACTSFVVDDDYQIHGTFVTFNGTAQSVDLTVLGSVANLVKDAGWTWDPAPVNVRGMAGSNNAGGGTSISVTVPTNSVNDLMLVVITARGTTTTVTNSSWTQLWKTSDGTNSNTSLWWRRSNGSEPATYSFALGATVKASACAIALWSIPSSDPAYDVHGNQANASSATIASPKVTPNYDAELAIFVGGTAYGTTISSLAGGPPYGWDYVQSASTGGGASSRTTTVLMYMQQPFSSKNVLGPATAWSIVVGSAATNVGGVITVQSVPGQSAVTYVGQDPLGVEGVSGI